MADQGVLSALAHLLFEGGALAMVVKAIVTLTALVGLSFAKEAYEEARARRKWESEKRERVSRLPNAPFASIISEQEREVSQRAMAVAMAAWKQSWQYFTWDDTFKSKAGESLKECLDKYGCGAYVNRADDLVACYLHLSADKTAECSWLLGTKHLNNSQEDSGIHSAFPNARKIPANEGLGRVVLEVLAKTEFRITDKSEGVLRDVTAAASKQREAAQQAAAMPAEMRARLAGLAQLAQRKAAAEQRGEATVPDHHGDCCGGGPKECSTGNPRCQTVCIHLKEPKLGHTKDNIVLVCCFVNRIFNTEGREKAVEVIRAQQQQQPQPAQA